MSGSSRDSGRRMGLLALALLTITTICVRAAEIETRDFVVFVSGKPAGDVHVTIHRRDDGSLAMRCDTDLSVHKLIGKYKYVYRGFELWKDHRLVRFDSTTNDNGMRYLVSAVAEADGIRIKVNNVERKIRSDVWLTSYWTLPDPKLRNGDLTLLDADNGTDFPAKLTYVATEKRKIAGQDVSLNHYRLTGKLQIDLWYDGSERLVRQEWMEMNHKTVMELVRVRR